MYNVCAYIYVIDLLQIQYERFGGKFLSFEHDLLIDSAESGIQTFIKAIEQMFYSRLDDALMGAIDDCLYFTEYSLFFFDSEDVFEGLDFLLELISICCPIHAGNAAKRIAEARIRASAFFSLRS